MESDKSIDLKESFEINIAGEQTKAIRDITSSVAILPITDQEENVKSLLKKASVHVEIVDEKKRSTAASKDDIDSDFVGGETEGNDSIGSVRLNSSIESEEKSREANLEGIYNRSFLIGSQSIREDLSTTNLLGVEMNDESTERNESSTQNNESTDSNNFLRPLARTDLNSSSQSSIDTRIKYGENGDLVPLIELNSNGQPIAPSVECVQPKHEPWYVIMLQILLPFFIAGFGMVAAGVVLDQVQHWEVYEKINAIYTLVPALLGLKGNLEMTLASRLSTQANLGKINCKTTILHAMLGNFALTQAQAIVVGFLASIGAVLLKFLTDREFNYQNSLVLVAGSMSTASFASLLLAGLMMSVIILSRRLNINPDNVATPIAASLGDLVTLTILSLLCTFLYSIKTFTIIPIGIIFVFSLLVPLYAYYSHKNEFVNDALHNSWIPIILAMLISSSGGYLMGFAVNVYKSIAVFQPVVNGVGGNLVAIFASRLSTALHRTSSQGTRASWAPTKWYRFPWDTFFGKSNPESTTALVLAGLTVPGHLVFFYTISKIKAGHNVGTLNLDFVSFYLFLAFLQVIILLLIGYWIVHYAWSRNKNPDNICIPYLTAFGDLIGTAFLAICFHLLFLLGSTSLRDPA